MSTDYCRFKDIRLLGGWLTVMWKPRLCVWWSTDAAPPDRLNRGAWLIGKKHRGEIP